VESVTVPNASAGATPVGETVMPLEMVPRISAPMIEYVCPPGAPRPSVSGPPTTPAVLIE
jgi:hypothetical protein